MVSARLLAAGTPRRQRLQALSLLGLLLDHADAGGKVRVPLHDLVGEFDLPRDQAEAALEALVRVEAVRRGAGGLLLAGCHPPRSGSLRLSAFLANVATVLDEEHAEPVPAAPARSPVLSDDPTPPPRSGGGRGQRRLRPRQPALAALALTGVVLLAALGPPSDPPTRLRTVGDPSTATTQMSAPAAPHRPLPANPWVSWPDSFRRPVPGGEPDAGDGEPTPGSVREPADSWSPPAEAPSRPDQGAVTAGAEGSTSEAEAGRPGGPPPGEEAPRRRTPQSAASPPAASPSPPAPVPALRCPAGAPQVVVDAAVVSRAGLDMVPAPGVPTTSVTEVRGTLSNPTEATAVIRSFEVVLGSGSSAVAVPGPPGPVVLAPGGREQWTVRTPSTAEPGTTPAVEGARIVDWEWQEADLVRSCPT